MSDAAWFLLVWVVVVFLIVGVSFATPPTVCERREAWMVACVAGNSPGACVDGAGAIFPECKR